MEFLHSLLVAAHLIGVSLLVGTFFVQMRQQSGHDFRLMLIGASIQLVTGVALVGVASAGEEDVNHIKIGVKGVIALVIFVVSLLGFLRGVAVRREKANLQANGGMPVADVVVAEPRLKTFFHIAGGLAVVNLLLAVFWQ